MNRRLFFCFAVLLGALGVLLLLSALAQPPAAEDTAAAALPIAHTITAFVSMPPTTTDASTISAAAWLRIAALFAAVTLLIPSLNCTCDANGRVLHSRRYVRSFYPVFKQDLACG